MTGDIVSCRLKDVNAITNGYLRSAKIENSYIKVGFSQLKPLKSSLALLKQILKILLKSNCHIIMDQSFDKCHI